MARTTYEGAIQRQRRVRECAIMVFEDEESATEWLNLPNPALEGERPIILAESEEGEKRVQVALGRIQHGIYT